MLLWADSFDHYGTGATGLANMLKGAWAQITADVVIGTAQARTGPRSLSNTTASATSGGERFSRRVIVPAGNTVGIGFGLYCTSLPTVAGTTGWRIRDGGGLTLVTCYVETDGSISVYRGTSTGTLLGVSDPVVIASSFVHIETKIIVDPIVGYVEIRVNGVVALVISDVNTGTNVPRAVLIGHRMGGSGTYSSPVLYWDDLIIWDDAGTFNNDFVGPARVLTAFCAADTAVADWAVVGAVSGVAAINEIPPNDDTSYISAADAADRSEFTLPALPPETAQVAAVYIPAYSKLDAAGIGDLQVSMLSGAAVAAGPIIALDTSYQYRGSQFETDPNTGLPFTKAGFDAALVRVEKTT